MKPLHAPVSLVFAASTIGAWGVLPRGEVPKIESRPAIKYLAVRKHAALSQLSKVIPEGIAEVGKWLGSHGMRPAGSPFVRYLAVNMPASMDVEIGFPTFGPAKGSAPLVSGAFPAGRYVTYIYTGSPAGLLGANATVLTWARDKKLTLDQAPMKHGVAWGARAEFYWTDPAHEPDPRKYKTQIVIRLAK